MYFPGKVDIITHYSQGDSFQRTASQLSSEEELEKKVSTFFKTAIEKTQQASTTNTPSKAALELYFFSKGKAEAETGWYQIHFITSPNSTDPSDEDFSDLGDGLIFKQTKANAASTIRMNINSYFPIKSGPDSTVPCLGKSQSESVAFFQKIYNTTQRAAELLQLV